MMYGPEAQKIVDYCQGVWDRERRSPGVYVLSAEEQAELSSEVATDGIAVSLLGGDPSVAVRVTSWINRSAGGRPVPLRTLDDLANEALATYRAT
jgi:hypothetical protein